MNSEIYSKLKKDLACKIKFYFIFLVEVSKILDEFRSHLKLSVSKLEEQLRDKVDRFNLDEFGKKIDTKFKGEIQMKMDKTDMKRNNSYLNKKVF